MNDQVHGAKVEIESVPMKGVSTVTKVFVDGVEFSAKTTKITYEHEAGKIPKVTLTLVPSEIHIRSVGDLCTKKLL